MRLVKPWFLPITLPEDKLKKIESLPEPEVVSVQQMLMVLVALKLSKTPEGLKLLRDLGKEFIKGIFDTLHALGQASAANKVSSWANPYLVSLVLDRFGFLPERSIDGFHLGLNIITGANIAEGFVDTLQGFFPFTAPEPSEYPSNIVYSGRTEGGTVVKETIQAKGLTQKELEQLRSLLGKK